METVFLIVVSFVASTLTATVGLGGGILLISVMPGLIPAAAIVPRHGAVQLASNSSRVLLGMRHIDWRVVWPFVGGSIVGAAAGVGMVARFSFEQLPLYLGLFVLVVTWMPIPSRVMAFPGQFAVLGAIQTYVSLFMGATGPLASPFLLRRGLSQDQLVITLGTVMMAIHVLKLVVFAVAGFVFAPYLSLVAGMVTAVVLGSWVGTKLRGRLPERALRRSLKGLITFLALRMIVAAVLVR
ncbi:MAG TPA: sulfite exporter TauE/SafE family protein [Acidobacteria bacterium]|nr:sulfite exporter TauE/SafE family protein [Acidobacteriota bacterium]